MLAPGFSLDHFSDHILQLIFDLIWAHLRTPEIWALLLTTKRLARMARRERLYEVIDLADVGLTDPDSMSDETWRLRMKDRMNGGKRRSADVRGELLCRTISRKTVIAVMVKEIRITLYENKPTPNPQQLAQLMRYCHKAAVIGVDPMGSSLVGTIGGVLAGEITRGYREAFEESMTSRLTLPIIERSDFDLIPRRYIETLTIDQSHWTGRSAVVEQYETLRLPETPMSLHHLRLLSPRELGYRFPGVRTITILSLVDSRLRPMDVEALLHHVSPTLEALRFDVHEPSATREPQMEAMLPQEGFFLVQPHPQGPNVPDDWELHAGPFLEKLVRIKTNMLALPVPWLSLPNVQYLALHGEACRHVDKLKTWMSIKSPYQSLRRVVFASSGISHNTTVTSVELSAIVDDLNAWRPVDCKIRFSVADDTAVTKRG